MKPFLKYPGGKTKEVPLVKQYMPNDINRYFEPFVGGASVYLALGIRDSYINDYSTDLINVYRYIKNNNIIFHQYLLNFDLFWHKLDFVDFNPEILMDYPYFDQALYLINYNNALTRKNKIINKLVEQGNAISQENYQKILTTSRKTAFYMLVRKIYNDLKVTNELKTACYYFLREYCYSSMFRFSKDGKFNVPYGGMSYNTKYMTSKIEYMFSKETIAYFKSTKIFNKDFEAFLNEYKFDDKDFIFLDPPYDSDFSTYDRNPFDKAEQIRLKNFLNVTKAKWMLIIKKTDFIYDLYKNFYIYEYDMNYMVSFKNRNEKNVEHLLITNYIIRSD